MDRYAVSGLSLAYGTRTFQGLGLGRKLAEKAAAARCELLVVDIETGETVEWMRIEGVMQEFYDAAVLTQPLRPLRGNLRKSVVHRKFSLSAKPKVIPKPVVLMHALLQDRHDPDVAIREMVPIDDMALVPKEEPFDAELGRDRFRRDTVGRNLV